MKVRVISVVEFPRDGYIIRKVLNYKSEIFIKSAPKNSNETYTFMSEWAVLGSAKTALKFKYEI